MTAIRIELQLQDGSFTSGMLRAGQSLSHFKSELARVNPHFEKLQKSGQDNFLMFNRQAAAATSFGTKLRNLSIIMGGLTLAFRGLTGAGNGTLGNLVRINAEMERLRFQLAGMSDAARPMEEAVQHIDNLQDLATQTPFSLRELSTSFVKLRAAGLDPTNGSLRSLTDGLAAFGAGDEYLHRVTIAIQQLQGKGVLSMEELRQQLGEAMPTAMRLMARSMGVTVGELSAMVATGTVESTSALQLWFAELERSYGGAGEFMMQSFSGLVTRMKTVLTRLTTRGEMGQAFEDLKGYLRDFVTFLETPRAQAFFDSLGRGLQNAMSLMEVLIESVSGLFDWFRKLAPVMVAVFGGSMILSGGRLLSIAFTRMRADFLSLTASTNTARSAMISLFQASRQAAAGAATATGIAATAAQARASSWRQAAAQRAAGAATAAIAPTVAAAGALANGSRWATGIGAIATAGRGLLGLLGPIALGLGVIAPLAIEIGRGVYSWYTGAQQANEEIRNITTAQTDMMRARRDEQREFLLRDRRHAEDRFNEFFDRNGDENSATFRALSENLERMNNRVHEFDRETERLLGEVVNSDEAVQSQIAQAMSRIATSRRDISREYNSAMNEADEQYQEDLAEAIENGESQRQVQERARERNNALRVRELQQRIDLYNEEIERMREMHSQGQIGEAALTHMIQERMRLEEQLANASPDDYRMTLLVAGEDENQKIERLGRTMENARQRVAGLSAELNGASGNIAELLYRIQRGDFGNLGDATSESEQLRNMLLEASIAAETLDEVTSRLNDAQSRIGRIRENLLEENVRLQAQLAGVDTDDDLAMWLFARENGMVPGLEETTQETIEAALGSVLNGVDTTQTAFLTLGEAIREGAFGQETQSAVGRVRDMLLEISGAVTNATTGFNQPLIGTPNGLGSLEGFLNYSNQGAVRNQGLSQRLLNAMSFLSEMSIVMDVFSGGQPGIGTSDHRVGSTRHDHGNAADVQFYMGGRMLDWANPDDIPILQEIVRRARANGITGIGAGPGYMRPGSMHLGFGGEAVWGAGGQGENAPQWLRDAFYSVLGPNTRASIGAGVDSRHRQINQTEAEALAIEERNRQLRAAAALQAMVESLEAASAAQEDETGALADYGTLGRRARQAQARGEFAGLDPADIAEMIRQADELDQRQEQITTRSREEREAAENRLRLEREFVELNQRREDALARVDDPNYREQSTDMRNLLRLESEQLAIAERLYGVDSDQYRLEVQRLATARSVLQTAEAAEALAELSRASEQSSRSAIDDERAQRRAAFDERVAQLRALRDRAIADGALVSQANMLYERAVAAERRRLQSENQTQLHLTLTQMRNLSERVNEDMAKVPQILSNGIYDALTGGNIGDAVDALREMIARRLIDATVAQIMGPFEELLGGDGSSGSGLGGLLQSMMETITSGIARMFQRAGGATMMGPGSLLGKKSGGVKMAHGGGIAGALSGPMRDVSLAHFLGAPKFHTGGIIGPRSLNASGMGLLPSEVPIIAQRGEGVFTPEQMKHLGGSYLNQPVSINAPITVNASGGTPEQNADLAEQMAEQSERMFRGIVQEELIRQRRPGGLMS